MCVGTKRAEAASREPFNALRGNGLTERSRGGSAATTVSPSGRW